MPQELDAYKEHILKRCQELDGFRDQILEKCQGLPLAANVVGGLLSLQKRKDWISIVENKILKVSKNVEGEITPILKLSFDNLPSSSVKKCFAYCSIYSKDANIRGRALIEFWMAEGFLQEDVQRGTMMEEIGDDYIRVLLQSSLLEVLDEEWFGEATYQMHDLVHDVAEFVSKREQIDGEVRHLALTSDNNNLKYNARFGVDNIKYNARSALVRIMEDGISDKVLLRFQRLRMLSLCGMNTNNLPNAIGKAKHLRYLDASFSDIEVLPHALCKLYNLQTLKLDECWSLQCLPPGLSNLISLRHLQFSPRDKKFKMPPNMGQLTCLQTLSFFSVGEEKGHEIQELGSMKNLAGKIEISNLELVKGKEGARSANLFEKKKLVALCLLWGSTDRADDGDCNDERVLEGLEPHPNLRGFGLENYMGDRLPQWFGQLKVLTQLSFVNCKTFKDLPMLGHLPSLKIMELKNLPNLIEWKGLEGVNGPEFPKLKRLVIRDCCQLARVPSPFPSLEALEIRGNIQVSVVRDIIGKGASFLKRLSIYSMDVVENHLTSLKLFKISDCDNLIDIPSSTLEVCASLEQLIVSGCPKLMPCPLNLHQTPSLLILWFSGPNMFTTNVMPTGFKYLTNLGSLSLGPFTDDSVKSFDWLGLKACSSTLRRLFWYGSFGKHSCMPQQLEHLTSLRWLQLCSLNSVEVLPDWLGNLTSLQELELRDCPTLQHLPSAHAMGRLVNLRELEICNCPLLPVSSVQDISTTLPNLKISRR